MGDEWWQPSMRACLRPSIHVAVRLRLAPRGGLTSPEKWPRASSTLPGRRAAHPATQPVGRCATPVSVIFPSNGYATAYPVTSRCLLAHVSRNRSRESSLPLKTTPAWTWPGCCGVCSLRRCARPSFTSMRVGQRTFTRASTNASCSQGHKCGSSRRPRPLVPVESGGDFRWVSSPVRWCRALADPAVLLKVLVLQTFPLQVSSPESWLRRHLTAGPPRRVHRHRLWSTETSFATRARFEINPT